MIGDAMWVVALLVLQYGPLIYALILALTLPKTWIGRGIALFPALAFVYIDWQTIGQLEADNWMGLGGAVIMFWLHVSLLVLYTVAAAIREASSKVSLALLFAIWFVSIFFKKLLLS